MGNAFSLQRGEHLEKFAKRGSLFEAIEEIYCLVRHTISLEFYVSRFVFSYVHTHTRARTHARTYTSAHPHTVICPYLI